MKNDVWCLRMGRKILEWVKVHTKGQPPCPRYMCSMNYYEEGNQLVIHGGRNDTQDDSFALNDTYLLDTSKFEWIRVIFTTPNGEEIHNERRCGHSSIIYSKIMR
jgi:hypothetical protein